MTDARPADTAGPDGAVADSGGTGDAPAVTRPDAMGAACATGGNYAFTVRPFVVAEGDVHRLLHRHAQPGAHQQRHRAVGRRRSTCTTTTRPSSASAPAATSTSATATAYASLVPIKYTMTDYHFRLVVDVPGKKYAAYVTYGGMPEVTLGTDLAFRDSSDVPTQFSHWGVEAVAGSNMRMCGFLVVTDRARDCVTATSCSSRSSCRPRTPG